MPLQVGHDLLALVPAVGEDDRLAKCFPPADIRVGDKLVARMMRRFRETRSEGMKKWYGQFLANTRCTSCAGSRLRRESAAVLVGERSIVDVSALTVDGARAFFRGLRLEGSARQIATACIVAWF